MRELAPKASFEGCMCLSQLRALQLAQGSSRLCCTWALALPPSGDTLCLCVKPHLTQSNQTVLITSVLFMHSNRTEVLKLNLNR